MKFDEVKYLSEGIPLLFHKKAETILGFGCKQKTFDVMDKVNFLSMVDVDEENEMAYFKICEAGKEGHTYLVTHKMVELDFKPFPIEYLKPVGLYDLYVGMELIVKERNGYFGEGQKVTVTKLPNESSADVVEVESIYSKGNIPFYRLGMEKYTMTKQEVKKELLKYIGNNSAIEKNKATQFCAFIESIS